MMSCNSPLSGIDAGSSPPAILSQVISSQKSTLAGLEMHPPQKRRLNDYPETDSIKRFILKSEEQKILIFEAIDSKLEKITDSMMCKMDILISNQNELITMMANTNSRMQANPPLHLQHGYQHQYFPSLPPFTNKIQNKIILTIIVLHVNRLVGMYHE